MATDRHEPEACIANDRCLCECRYCYMNHTDNPLILPRIYREDS